MQETEGQEVTEIVSEDFLYAFDKALTVAALVFAAVFAALSALHARKRRSLWVFSLLACAYGCSLMGYMLTVFHYAILGEYPYVFSAADVSFIGEYCFMITILLGLRNELPAEQRQAAGKYRYVALAGPAAVILCHALCIAIYPDIFLNYVLFCIPMAFLGYYTVLLFLAARDSAQGPRGERPPMYAYYLVALLYLACELVMSLVSTIGLWLFADIMWVISLFFVVARFWAARKGAWL